MNEPFSYLHTDCTHNPNLRRRRSVLLLLCGHFDRNLALQESANALFVHIYSVPNLWLWLRRANLRSERTTTNHTFWVRQEHTCFIEEICIVNLCVDMPCFFSWKVPCIATFSIRWKIRERYVRADNIQTDFGIAIVSLREIILWWQRVLLQRFYFWRQMYFVSHCLVSTNMISGEQYDLRWWEQGLLHRFMLGMRSWAKDLLGQACFPLFNGLLLTKLCLRHSLSLHSFRPICCCRVNQI